MNRKMYRMLWVLEIVSVILLALAITVPVQDYALKEFVEWRRHPSSETYRALVEKKRQESGVHLVLAAPFLVLAVLIGGALAKHRKNS